MMQLDKQSLRVLMKKKRLDIGEKTFFLHSQSILQKGITSSPISQQSNYWNICKY